MPAVLPDKTKRMIVLRVAVLNDARRRLGFKLADLVKASGVGYGSICRALKGDPIGADLAARLAEALQVPLADVTASDQERRPPEGYSADALAHFNRLFCQRVEKVIAECYRTTREEAKRRSWFWPGPSVIRSAISVRQRIASGEVSLL